MQIPDQLQLLLARFDGRLVIPFIEALDVLSYNQQTARNELCRKVFPIPVIKRGCRNFISVHSLAKYLQEQVGEAPTKKRGRPRKVGDSGGAK